MYSEVSNLFLQAPVAICILRGPEYVIEVVNEKMVEMWDRKTPDVLNKPAFDVLTELKDQGFKELLDGVFYSGKRYVTEELPINLKRHGKIENAFVKFVYEPLRDEDGTISGVMALAHEITEQVLARKQVEDAERKTSIAIESAALGMYEIDLVSNEMIGDARVYEIFGFNEKVSRSELVFVIHPEDLTLREIAHKESLISGKLYYKARVIYKDKSLHWLKVSGKVFYNEANLPIKLLGVVDDITVQKQMQKQKANLLAIASHELKTPVTTIKAYAQLVESILESDGETVALPLIKKMGSQVDKLTALIENLLNITKIQEGKLAYNETIFDFNEMVREVIEDMQVTCVTHHIEYIAGKSANIFGDKEKVGEVINNLISNARKYSPNASNIIVTTEIQKDAVQLSVRDFGIGISSEAQENVFKQFYRVNGENQSTYPGMGIGLYICSEFIKGHNGKIWVESILGEGSIFYIWIQLHHENAAGIGFA
jgi:two-component system sensor histidine kinase VicK